MAHIRTIKKNVDVCKDIALTENTGKNKYINIGHRRGMMANEHIMLGSNSYEKVKTFNYFASLLKKNIVLFSRK